jgi:hypothetical protein
MERISTGAETGRVATTNACAISSHWSMMKIRELLPTHYNTSFFEQVWCTSSSSGHCEPILV